MKIVYRLEVIHLSFDEQKLKDVFNKCSTNFEPKPNYFKRCLLAFIIGGFFCLLGEFFFKLYGNYISDSLQARAVGSITMIFIGALLTGFGIYDRIGNVAGAGSIVPITGFANAVSSPAIEFKKEGIVFGTCVKMFTIAGSVIVFGVSSSIVVGLIYFLYTRFVG